MPKVNKTQKPKPKTIQITEKDGEVKKIGKYTPDSKVFRAVRNRSEHFMIKHNAWGLDAKVVDFLVKEGAVIVIRDKESKWEFKCEAGDFKVYGILEEHQQHRPQYFLPLNFWEVIRANNKSFIIKCEETSCRNNFGNNCLRGVITINKNGECDNYEDRI